MNYLPKVILNIQENINMLKYLSFIREDIDETKKMSFETHEKIVEITAQNQKTFDKVLKKVKRLSKFMQIPEPKVDNMGIKKYYTAKIFYNTGSYLIDTISENPEDIKVVIKEIEKERKEQVNCKIISIDATIYKLTLADVLKPSDEWIILGVLDHIDGTVRAAPNQQIPFDLIPQDLKGSSQCDHCNTKRKRNKTAYIKNITSGKIMRVGGSCIKYYLGYDYEHILDYLSEITFFEKEKVSRESFGGKIEFEQANASIDDAMKYFIWFCKKNGYRSKKAAETINSKIEAGGEGKMVEPTTSLVLTHLNWIFDPPNFFGKFAGDARKEHEKDCQDFIEHVKDVKQEEIDEIKKFVDDNYKQENYLINAKNLIDRGYVEMKLLRYVIGACSMFWGKKMWEDRKNATTKSDSEWVGEKGAKIPLENLTVKRVGSYSGAFGPASVYTLEDENGNIFTKFGTINNKFIVDDSTDIKIGSKLSFTAEIKDHTTFNNIKQTVIGRVSKL